ncbi:MAG: transcription elongation factor GreA [Lachnospiraceae bacterium]|nr:transcription elongation factor GreA [Lachnospiraceae bacterium]
MADKKTIVTEEGLKALQDELQDLKVNKRKEIADKIKEARAQGDLSENAEYDAAKDEQRAMEGRIEEIEAILKNVEVVDSKKGSSKAVHIGSTVKISDLELNKEFTYQIVGSTEADIMNNKISNESPVGAALLGAKKGDTVEVETPSGKVLKYKVLEISKKK